MTSPVHYFDVALASKFGLQEAILLQDMLGTLRGKKSRGEHFYPIPDRPSESRFWCYDTVKSFQARHTYLTEKQVRSAINSLINQGCIIAGNFNQSAYDRTRWFCLADETLLGFSEQKNEEISRCTKGQMDLLKTANQNAEKGEPIPIDTYKEPIEIIKGASAPKTKKPFYSEKDFLEQGKEPCETSPKIYLTADEKTKVVNRYEQEGLGVEWVKRSIELLDIMAHNSPRNFQKYSSHYHCLIGWCLQKVKQEARDSNNLEASEKRKLLTLMK